MPGQDNDADYRIQAERAFESLRDIQKIAVGAQVGYGRWLINSLWLMHSGAIVGLIFKSSGSAPPPYLGAIWWFIAGIAFAFFAGFAAWLNFSMFWEKHAAWADVRMLTNPKHWPRPDPKYSFRIRFTLRTSVGCGVLSLACLIGGAAAVWYTWR